MPFLPRFVRRAVNSLRLILVSLRRIIWSAWLWKKENTQLCFSCWTIWNGCSMLPATKAANCPSCKLITIALQTEGLPDIGSWYVVLRAQNDGIASILDDTCPDDEPGNGPQPLYLELRLNRDWNTMFWVSYEKDGPYSRQTTPPNRQHTFNVLECIDGSLLRSWIEKCDAHGDACALNVSDSNSTRDLNKYEIYLVDVQEKRLIRCPLLPKNAMRRYLALSYVWGASDFFKTTNSNVDSLLQPGGLAQAFVSLPKTFTDAMKLVQLVGERYIWIDALCIIQDDTIKHDQLNIMDQIYGRAYITIVCLAGENVHSGLPGLSPGTRLRRPLRGQFNQGAFTAALPSLEQAIKGSVHYTRAWTFQETFLSRRCLFVSEGQFFFRCSKSYYSESMDWQARILGKASDFGLASSPAYWNQAIYEASVEQYTVRKLSYDQDIINAFQGALARMKQLGYRPRGDKTMDLMHPNALLWFSVDKHAKRRSELTEVLGSAFPTWSWTGWKGAITYASLSFGRNISTYTTTLRWSHRTRWATGHSFEPVNEDDEFTKPKDFCTKPHCSSLTELSLGPPQPNHEPYDDFRHLNLYRFCASVCTASNFTYPSWQSYVHKNSNPQISVALLDIYDADQRRCGALFNPPLESLDNSELHIYSLVAVSMKKQYDWLEGISTLDYDTKDPEENMVIGCGCWLNIMLVKKAEGYDGLVERVAVGQMHPRAWAEAKNTIETITMM